MNPSISYEQDLQDRPEVSTGEATNGDQLPEARWLSSPHSLQAPPKIGDKVSARRGIVQSTWIQKTL